MIMGAKATVTVFTGLIALKRGGKAGFHPQVIHFIEMNKSCTDERNILTNKSKYRKNILFHLLIFADSG